MSIGKIRVNGMTNPIGFQYRHLNISYTVQGHHVGAPYLFISDGEKTVYRKRISYKESFCTPVDFTPSKETRYYVTIKWGEDESERSYFETGTDFDSPFITPEEDISHPVLTKRFVLRDKIKSARLYITGVGLYEAELNGQKVGTEFLTPYCNDYDAYLQYQTYDIGDMVGQENTISISLGNGWYKGRFGLNHRENIYGDRFAAAAKIVIVYQNGERQIIRTDPSWTASNSSIISSGIYDGEVRDDTVPVRSCKTRLYEKTFHVVPRLSVPVCIHERLTPSFLISPKGEKILDFKQNFAGTFSFHSRLKRGQRVRVAASEVLQDGCFYRDNLRSAKAEFVYTSDGVEKDIEPKFTFFGFRYLLLEGFDEVDPSDFVGLALYSDLLQTVKIETDNSKINRLLSNCLWGQKSNFLDVPTDCPQRDERLGWTGDAEVFSATACYQADCRAFYAKYMHDIENDYRVLGGIPNYSPAMKEAEVATSVWADVATIIPWNVYTFYGDKQLLSEQYPLIELYAKQLIREDDLHGGLRRVWYGVHLGDWLSQDGAGLNALKAATDEYFIASVYYYNSVLIASMAAAVLKKKEESIYFRRIAREIKRSLLHEYFSPGGRLTVDTQTAYVICLKFGIYRNKKVLLDCFAKRLKEDAYRIKGGFVGATSLIQTMLRNGMVQDAFRMLYSEKYPSWLYCVNLGATTIWERWNSLNADGRISGTTMNSLNHYSYGSVAEAFYADIAGLKPLTAGFKKVEISPAFNYRLKKLNFTFLSPSGEYKIYYEIHENTAKLAISVPDGAEAEIKIGGVKTNTLGAGLHEMELCLDEDFTRPFSLDTPLCELLDNKNAVAVLSENIPALFSFLSKNELGLFGNSFNEITKYSSFKIEQSKKSEIEKKLKELRA